MEGMNGDEIKVGMVEVKGESHSMEAADVDQIFEPVCELMPELRAAGSEERAKDFPEWLRGRTTRNRWESIHCLKFVSTGGAMGSFSAPDFVP